MKKPIELEKNLPIRFKSGRDILKEYYLKHKFLNEQDLDELVAKSNMSYEQVREWFAEIHRKEEMGTNPFEDKIVNEEQDEEEDESQGENETPTEEQGPTVLGDEDGDEDEEDTDDSDTWEPPQSVRKTLSMSEAQ